MQREDAHKLIVFHLSNFGYKDEDAHIDVIVNGGEKQPSCGKDTVFGIRGCSHGFIWELHYLIARTSWPKLGMDGNMSGVYREDGHVVVHEKNGPSKRIARTNHRSDKPLPSLPFSISLLKTPLPDISGTFHMKTSDVMKIREMIDDSSVERKNTESVLILIDTKSNSIVDSITTNEDYTLSGDIDNR